MSVVVITPPEPIVELDLAKLHCRVDDNDSDALITAYIAAAQASIDGPDGWLKRAIGPQTLELRLDSFLQDDWRDPRGLYPWQDGFWTSWSCRWPYPTIQLPCPPFISIVSITYEDLTGADQVLTSAGWSATEEGVTPDFGDVWPSGRVTANAVRIRYLAGYVVDPTANPLVPAIPPAIIAAVLMLVGDLYENRAAQVIDARAVVAANPTVASLLGPYRILRV